MGRSCSAQLFSSGGLGGGRGGGGGCSQCFCFEISLMTKFACAPCGVFCHECASFYGLRVFPYFRMFPWNCAHIVCPTDGTRTERPGFGIKNTHRLGFKCLRSAKPDLTVSFPRPSQNNITTARRGWFQVNWYPSWRLEVKWRQPWSIFALALQCFFFAKIVAFAVDSVRELS